jgi:hypothetical protein
MSGNQIMLSTYIYVVIAILSRAFGVVGPTVRKNSGNLILRSTDSKTEQVENLSISTSPGILNKLNKKRKINLNILSETQHSLQLFFMVLETKRLLI